MKNISSTIRSLVTTVTLGALVSIANAGPGIQYWKSLGRNSQIKDVKLGETVLYVCNACKSVSNVRVTSKTQAMDYCKEGATVICPSCKMKTKVVIKRQRNDPPTHTEVVYVNEKGEECAFFAKAPAKK